MTPDLKGYNIVKEAMFLGENGSWRKWFLEKSCLKWTIHMIYCKDVYTTISANVFYLTVYIIFYLNNCIHIYISRCVYRCRSVNDKGLINIWYLFSVCHAWMFNFFKIFTVGRRKNIRFWQKSQYYDYDDKNTLVF